MIIPSEINAVLPDSEYKNYAYSIKPSYDIIISLINNDILLSENAVSRLNFDSSEAKKKIENAMELRWMALSSKKESDDKLYQVESFFKKRQYENSYNKLLDIDKHLYAAKDDLRVIVFEIKEARNLEKKYQENNRNCFFFWCDEIKNTYGILDPAIRNLESKLVELDDHLQRLETNQKYKTQSIHKTEIKIKNQELQELENIRIQQEYDYAKQEKQLEEEIKQKQLEVKRQEQLRIQQEYEAEQERQRLEAQIQAEKQSKLDILASTNPLLKQIMTGEITFFAERVPYYAAPGVETGVERILDNFNNWKGVKRVYERSGADIKINWVKEFSPGMGGQHWQSHVQVGLGWTTYHGEWQPFTSHSVRQVLWHEIGHAMGYGHSSDQNNIMMGNGLEKFFYNEYDDDIFLHDGSFSLIKFYRDGQYSFQLNGNSQYSGFRFYVIPPETDSSEFIFEGKGKHYPDCTSSGTWVSNERYVMLQKDHTC